MSEENSTNISVTIENLTEYLTSAVSLASKFYDIFFNEEPMDVTFQQWTENGLEEVTIPNRAKDKAVSLTGEGSPEGTQAASIGTIYVDTLSSTVYFKTAGDDEFGWTPVLTEEQVSPLIDDAVANKHFIKIEDVEAYLTENGYVTQADVINYLVDNYYITRDYLPENGYLNYTNVDESSVICRNTPSGYQLKTAGIMDSNGTESIKKVWTGVQSQYDLINPKDPNTIYIVTEN